MMSYIFWVFFIPSNPCNLTSFFPIFLPPEQTSFVHDLCTYFSLFGGGIVFLNFRILLVNIVFLNFYAHAPHHARGKKSKKIFRMLLAQVQVIRQQINILIGKIQCGAVTQSLGYEDDELGKFPRPNGQYLRYLMPNKCSDCTIVYFQHIHLFFECVLPTQFT